MLAALYFAQMPVRHRHLPSNPPQRNTHALPHRSQRRSVNTRDHRRPPRPDVAPPAGADSGRSTSGNGCVGSSTHSPSKLDHHGSGRDARPSRCASVRPAPVADPKTCITCEHLRHVDGGAVGRRPRTPRRHRPTAPQQRRRLTTPILYGPPTTAPTGADLRTPGTSPVPHQRPPASTDHRHAGTTFQGTSQHVQAVPGCTGCTRLRMDGSRSLVAPRTATPTWTATPRRGVARAWSMERPTALAETKGLPVPVDCSRCRICLNRVKSAALHAARPRCRRPFGPSSRTRTPRPLSASTRSKSTATLNWRWCDPHPDAPKPPPTPGDARPQGGSAP
jgi:hypothetical protein